jgi:hypothetical protein
MFSEGKEIGLPGQKRRGCQNIREHRSLQRTTYDQYNGKVETLLGTLPRGEDSGLTSFASLRLDKITFAICYRCSGCISVINEIVDLTRSQSGRVSFPIRQNPEERGTAQDMNRGVLGLTLVLPALVSICETDRARSE